MPKLWREVQKPTCQPLRVSNSRASRRSSSPGCSRVRIPTASRASQERCASRPRSRSPRPRERSGTCSSTSRVTLGGTRGCPSCGARRSRADGRTARSGSTTSFAVLATGSCKSTVWRGDAAWARARGRIAEASRRSEQPVESLFSVAAARRSARESLRAPDRAPHRT
jgi:hypothetical protein